MRSHPKPVAELWCKCSGAELSCCFAFCNAENVVFPDSFSSEFSLSVLYDPFREATPVPRNIAFHGKGGGGIRKREDPVARSCAQF